MTLERFATELDYPECPRWHDGSLGLSEMWSQAVVRFAPVHTWCAPDPTPRRRGPCSPSRSTCPVQVSHEPPARRGASPQGIGPSEEPTGSIRSHRHDRRH